MGCSRDVCDVLWMPGAQERIEWCEADVRFVLTVLQKNERVCGNLWVVRVTREGEGALRLAGRLVDDLTCAILVDACNKSAVCEYDDRKDLGVGLADR